MRSPHEHATTFLRRAGVPRGQWRAMRPHLESLVLEVEAELRATLPGDEAIARAAAAITKARSADAWLDVLATELRRLVAGG